MTLDRLVLATANPGKVRELTALVREWGGVDVLSLADVGPVEMPDETGATYAENAALKARAVCAATSLPALADDSGIEVDALGGRPGVYSARYAASEGAANAKLLAELRDVPDGRRTARYQAVVVLALPDGRLFDDRGTCEGRIAGAPRGDGGFGYDPIFVSTELGRVVAEASAEEKARVSHRAQAVRALGRRLGLGGHLKTGHTWTGQIRP
jgi:XTP/dITP diphosphohydrolase